MKNLKFNEAEIIIGAKNKCVCHITEQLSIESEERATINSCSHDCCIVQGAIFCDFYDANTEKHTQKLCANKRQYPTKRVKVEEIIHVESLPDFNYNFYNSSTRQ